MSHTKNCQYCQQKSEMVKKKSVRKHLKLSQLVKMLIKEHRSLESLFVKSKLNVRWLSRWMGQWQGRLLSCSGQLKSQTETVCYRMLNGSHNVSVCTITSYMYSIHCYMYFRRQQVDPFCWCHHADVHHWEK